MKIKHLSLVGSDYRRLRDFYQDLLNLKLDFDDEKGEYCQFDLGQGLKIDFESQKVIKSQLPNLDFDIKLLVRIEVKNVDKVYKKVKRENKVLSRPTNQSWGMKNFYLLDPAKNLVEFYQVI